MAISGLTCERMRLHCLLPIMCVDSKYSLRIQSNVFDVSKVKEKTFSSVIMWPAYHCPHPDSHYYLNRIPLN